MKKIFVILLMINLAVAYLLLTSVDEVDVETANTKVISDQCALLSFNERVEQSLFLSAVSRLGKKYTVENEEIWVASEKKWLVTEENLNKNKVIRELVPGAYLIENGPYRGKVSLGIFSNTKNADRLKAKFEKKSLKAIVLPYQQKASAERVLIRLEGIESLLNSYHVEFIEKKSCLGVVNAH